MSSKAKRTTILGLETTPGDGATPDVAISAKMSLKPVVDKIVPDRDTGSFAPSPHYIGALKAEGKLDFMDAYYEHSPYPISMALGAGSKTGAGDPWTYTWTLPGATAPTFATYRVEYSDGNNHIVRADDVFATALEIKGEAAKGLQIIADVVGGSATYPAALGASLSHLAAPTSMRMAETSLYLNDTFGAIGSTAVGVLISFSWKIESYMHQKQFSGSLFPTSRGNDKWKITLEIIVEIDQATVEAQKDKLLTTSLTAVRVKALASANDSLTMDGMWALMDVDSLDDRDGNNICKFTYQAEPDASANMPSVVVVTNLSAL